jgi:hypothetical protein
VTANRRLLTVPRGVVTVITPVLAPGGTAVVSSPSELIVKLAGTPLNATACFHPAAFQKGG